MDIDIELLQLNIADASGHEHRLGTIAARAAEILAERLQDREQSDRHPAGGRRRRISARPMRLDLNRMSDERAALSIATAWLEAVSVKLEAGG